MSQEACDRNHFGKNCQAHGLAIQGCGLGAVKVLNQYREQPLLISQTRANGKAVRELGILIKHGLMQITPDRSGYAITPKGLQWLSDLVKLNLLPDPTV